MKPFMFTVFILLNYSCNKNNRLEDKVIYESLEISNEALAESTVKIHKYFENKFEELPNQYYETISVIDEVEKKIRDFHDLKTLEDKRKAIPALKKFFKTLDQEIEYSFLCLERDFDDNIFSVVLKSDLIINKHRIYTSLFVKNGLMEYSSPC